MSPIRLGKPLIPPSKVRPQVGGTQDTPDETQFAAITYVLVSGCAWRDELPTVEGTLLRLQVDRLSGGGGPLPLWL